MDKNIDDIKHIRSMMERSTKFLSLSGFSGIGAGVVALIGAYIAKQIIAKDITITGNLFYDLSIVATTVLIVASACGLYFSKRKAQKKGDKLWSPVTIQILKDFLVPLGTGGAFCLAMLIHGSSLFIASAMLIFYGLALIASGSRLYRDIKILGACEVILGILAAIFTHQGLLFWSIGFGVLHIVYGIIIYLKYDRESAKSSKS